ncbi:MAG: uracil-DNA glycosylase [Thermoplasmatales archaeon]|nr:uracil-DNA glycosylase [Thermoplasmatales archaeon]
MSKQEKMEKIAISVENCRKCDLYKTRNKPVAGDGAFNTKILFIGEAPGRNEDLQGKPFVGKAGKILDDLLDSIGMQRGDVFIANILKCRPPNNRNPLSNEIKACTQYLGSQITLIQPKIIVPLGNFAASYIFEKFGLKIDKISNTRGKVFETNTIFGNIKIIPMYHPAVATYNPNTINILKEDFRVIKDAIEKFR